MLGAKGSHYICESNLTAEIDLKNPEAMEVMLKETEDMQVVKNEPVLQLEQLVWLTSVLSM